jgi:hypothetical protein
VPAGFDWYPLEANAFYKELLELSQDYPGMRLLNSDYEFEELGGLLELRTIEN